MESGLVDGHRVQPVASCVGTSFSSARVYNKVCGRVIGYQVANTDGFGGGAQ